MATTIITKDVVKTVMLMCRATVKAKATVIVIMIKILAACDAFQRSPAVHNPYCTE